MLPFLVLILKKGVKDWRDFRSIRLVGSLSKFLAKVIANRVKKITSKLTSGFQNAFCGWEINLDAAFIADKATRG